MGCIQLHRLGGDGNNEVKVGMMGILQLRLVKGQKSKIESKVSDGEN